MTAATGWVHHYISTACEHALGEGRPELHGGCRLSCKFADDGVEPCECPCHTGLPLDQFPPPWVDQARDIAIELLASVDDHSRGIILSPDLEERIRTDPHLFWLRGEVQPPGEWKPNTDQTG